MRAISEANIPVLWNQFAADGKTFHLRGLNAMRLLCAAG
jgi:hypothetical protein